MKKLLSLLSVLTISGTAVPTTIAASHYQKEETKLENNKIRIKRTIRNIDLNANFPNVKQLRNMWCGPAVVEAILKYFGLNPLLLNNIQGEDGYQSLLANRMQTSDTIGTFPNNLLSVINQAINERNLNNRRQYSITTLPSNYGNHLQFYNLIRNSIENNVPVILAHNGILPSTNNNEDTPNNQHFIVIIGITYNTEDPNSSTYRYMDPATESVNSFRGYDLRNILNASNFNTDTNTLNRSSSFLLSYINPAQTISLNINQTEMMECDYGLGKNSITLMLQNYCSSENSRNTRSTSELAESGKVYWVGYNLLDKDAYLLPGIPDNVTSMALLNKDSAGELKTNSAYIGTTNGLYYRKGNGSDEVKKVSGLNEPIQSIIVDNDGSAWTLTEIIKFRKQKSPGWFSSENNNSQDKDSKTCLAISDENPYFDKNKDKITWYSRVPAHAGIQAFLSLKTAQVIEKIFFEKRNSGDFKRYLINLFKKMPTSNSESDFELLAKCISQGFLEFRDKILELEKMNDNNKLIVVEIHANFKNFDFSYSTTGSNVDVFSTSLNIFYII